MQDFFIFIAPAFVMSLILLGICAYIGIHVVMREIIFIDIALAQLAALGVSLGMLAGLAHNSPYILIVSFSLTILGAALLALIQTLKKEIPQEAFIGILYAIGAAGVLLVNDQLAHGGEHMHDLMCGHLLWVSWREVAVYLAIYIILGGVFLVLHSRLHAISKDKKMAAAGGIHLVRWDFIFYALLGIVVTFAVRVAGVLFVFGLLIVPAVIGALLTDSFSRRLLVGWITGVITIMIGCGASYYIDLPTGATVVVCLGAALLIIAFIKGVQIWREKE